MKLLNYLIMGVVLMDDKMHDCFHEELIQSNNLRIVELDKEVQFKKEKIDNLQMKIDEIDKKIDDLHDNVNKIVLASTKGDTDLELRLKTIETRQEAQEKTRERDNQKYMRLIAAMTLLFAALTFVFNFIIKH